MSISLDSLLTKRPTQRIGQNIWPRFPVSVSGTVDFPPIIYAIHIIRTPVVSPLAGSLIYFPALVRSCRRLFEPTGKHANMLRANYVLLRYVFTFFDISVLSVYKETSLNLNVRECLLLFLTVYKSDPLSAPWTDNGKSFMRAWWQNGQHFDKVVVAELCVFRIPQIFAKAKPIKTLFSIIQH